MDADYHDRILAITSHLPHLIAFTIVGTASDLEMDIKKVNLDGGAISLGHPLGATGARITGKAAELLVRENKKYALATQCIGYGMGIATIIEAL